MPQEKVILGISSRFAISAAEGAVQKQEDRVLFPAAVKGPGILGAGAVRQDDVHIRGAGEIFAVKVQMYKGHVVLL